MVEVEVKNVNITESVKRPSVNKKRTKEAISVLKKLNEAFQENKTKKSLLDDSSESSVYLQVTLKKIPPKAMKSMIKVHLPHSLMTDTTEVCLFTGDLEKNNKKAEIEPTILHYKELLKKYDVKGISEVVPLRQLRTEYKTFESKRQLSAAYDVFITDKKITGCLPKVLGKAFYDSRKFPIQINLATSNLKDQVERAVSETVFSLSCRGNSCTSQVARLSMDDDDILKNILSCVGVLSEKLPGSWDNIQGLYIKTGRSEAIPIYMSFDSANELIMKAPRHREKVKAEELSTVRNAEVKVFKDGRTIVKNLPESEDENNEDVINEDVKPSSDTKVTEDVLANDKIINEDKEKDSTKPKNKRKKTKELVEDTEDVLANDKIINEGKEKDSTKPKNKRKKTKELFEDTEDVLANDKMINEDKEKDSTKPKNKKKKTKELVEDTEDVLANDKMINEGKEKDSTKPKNKRKKTKELVDNTKELVDNKAKEESCDNEDTLPKIKRRKTKDSSNEDTKMIEIKKKKTSRRNNKKAEK